jgi:hypothetical protein
MKSSLRVLQALLILLTLSSAACGDREAASTSGADKPGASSGASASTEKAPAAPAAKPELEEMTNDKIGYTMKMPKGFVTSVNEDAGAVYLAGDLIISAQIAPQPLTKVDDILVGYVTEGMTLEKKTDGQLLLVIGHKDGEPMPFNVFAAPKGAKLSVHCVGDAANKDLAREVCSSVRIKK